MLIKDTHFRYHLRVPTDSTTAGDLNLVIRKARTKDLPNLKWLYRNSIGALCQLDYTRQELTQWMLTADDAKRWRRAITNQYFLVAEVGQTMAGFVSLDHGDYVDFLFVHPGFNGLGVGSILYKLVEDKSKSLQKSQIHVHASITAKSFFQYKGFKVKQKNKIKRNGVVLINFHMTKNL